MVVLTVEFEATTQLLSLMKTSTGFAASYTMGSMTISRHLRRLMIDDEAGTSGTDEILLLRLVLAFAF